MNLRLLKIQGLVVAATLSIAILLFAAQKHNLGTGPQFRAVVDLTAASTLKVDLSSAGNTILVAPAKTGGVWTVDTLPPARLVAPLAVIEAQHKNFPDSESLVTMNDVADFDRRYGTFVYSRIDMHVDQAKPLVKELAARLPRQLDGRPVDRHNYLPTRPGGEWTFSEESSSAAHRGGTP